MKRKKLSLRTVLNPVVIVLMAAIVVMTFVNAALRYTVGKNVLSFEEYSRFCFVWICYLGTIIAFEEKRHICVTIVSDLLKGTVKRAVVFVGRLIILAASGVVFYAGLLYLRRAVTYHTAATNTNMGVVVVGLPLTALCLIVIQAVDLYKACAGRRKKEG